MKGRSAALVVLWRAVRAGRRPGTPGIGERFRVIPRMLGARVRGRYQGLSWGRVTLLAAAVGYLVSPVDLLPELVLSIPGLLDDTLIAAWVAGVLLDETERFIEWERQGKSVIEGSASHAEPEPRP